MTTNTDYFGATAIHATKPYNGMEVDETATEGTVIVTLPNGDVHGYRPFRAVAEHRRQSRHAYKIVEGGAIEVTLYQWDPVQDSQTASRSYQRVVRVYGPTGYSAVEGTEGTVRNPIDADADPDSRLPGAEFLTTVADSIRRSGSLTD